MRSAFRLSVIWLVLLTTAFGPLADGWMHAMDRDADHGHGLAVSFETPDEHESCDSWQAAGPSHDLHQKRQFEPVLELRHGEHGALCASCGHRAPAVTGRSHRASALITAADLAWLRGPHLGHISRGSARPRAPPRA